MRTILTDDDRAIPEFDAYADSYDDALNRGIAVSGESRHWFARERLRWLGRRLAMLGVPRGGTVLDFGCGIGASTPFFFEHLGAERVIGVEVSGGLLGVARRDYGDDARVEFSMIGERPIREEVDVAFVNGVFHHIPVNERADAVRYVHAALRPGGVFAFWENNPWSPGARYVMSRIAFDHNAVIVGPGEARALLHDAGFAVRDTSYRFIFPRALAWLRPLETSLARLPLGAQYLVLGVKR
jgi:SAM-dependent methyltransferase